ncbi:MAG: ribonuclease HII, partial [Candidatus Sericytochromatia bacterium]
QRDRFYDRILEVATADGVAEASPQEIDERNILQATFLAMRRAIAQAGPVEVVLVDGNRAISEFTLPQETLVKGDARSLSIAAASVIAKVTRDRALLALDAEFPAYGFSQHKGYPTAQHYAALAANGPCPHHRLSFLKRIL